MWEKEAWIVKLPGGKTKKYRRVEHESSAEFAGRVWVEIERAITGRRVGPTPQGTRVAIDKGGANKFPSQASFGEHYESTGNPYQNRWVRIRP